MNAILLSFIAGIGLSIATIGGDIFIKNASLKQGFSGWKELLLGCVIFAATGIGWFFVLRHLKLSTAGVLYSISGILLLVLASSFMYKERIAAGEIVGIACALISLTLLFKYA